jgi:DNA polymerase
MGTWELFLDDLTRREVLELADAARRRDLEGASEGPESAGKGAATSGEPSEAYVTLKKTALACQACRLSQGRTQVVFSDGTPRGRLMVIGEAPGAHEDRTGLAFVGPAGKLLDLLLASVGLSRKESVYICNVLKCRPPGNRDPLPDEIESCEPYLRQQIALLSPEAILATGSFAGQWLTGRRSPLGKLRGEVYSYEGVPVVVTYHPAALLRNAKWTRATWEDLQLVREILDRGDEARLSLRG